ncbi:Catenin-beta-like protein [Myxozyma melibiosi]|uniref:Catenin-beta-like protein n=1 Tax=Myxozyma melibiosi TaxID=54550 RepID=A0ABR1F116_9ASCO
MNIDSLFKRTADSTSSHSSNVPVAKKRRLDELSNLVDKYKNSTDDDLPSTVQDKLDDGQDDSAAVSDLPDDDDEGGRFFGGGLTENQKDVLDYVDTVEQDLAEEEKFDSAWVRKQVTKLDRLIKKNAQLRARYSDTPQKFLESEAELDSAVKSLSILTEHTDLYPIFVEQKGLDAFEALLAHENSDIVVDAIQVLDELIDEDTQAEETDLRALIDGMFEAGLVDSLITNLSRLDDSRRARGIEDQETTEGEEVEAERAGVFQILSVIESLTALTGTADKLLINTSPAARQQGDTGLLPWLLQRILVKEKPLSQNKQYAAEVLSIILQNSHVSRIQFINQVYNDSVLGELAGVDVLLRALSPYRRFDPPAEQVEETEFFENIFDALAVIVQEPLGKDKFLENEGVDLLLLFVKSGGKHGKSRAIKTLDYALASGASGPLALDFVNNDGLPILFKLLMSSRFTDAKNHGARERRSGDAHVSLDAVLGIISSLLRNLGESSKQKMKLLARFVEKNYEKLGRLMLFRTITVERVDRVDIVINAERDAFVKTKPSNPELLEDWEADREANEAEWYLRRMDDGVFRLQLIDTILAWLVAEDDDGDLGIKTHIVEFLKKKGTSFADLKATLTAFKQDITPGEVGDDEEMTEEEAEQRAEALDQSEMLTVLIDFLQ